MSKPGFRILLLPAIALSIFAADANAAPISAGARYVAMGSSYASGPGVTTSADTPPTRCMRSADNYPHQLARRRHLALTDVSCGGSTTANILGPWGELPPQIDAVTSDTQLVTVTIGGNDLGFVGGLMAASCRQLKGAPGAAPIANCPPASPPAEQAYADVEAHMRAIAAEVRRRAPAARVVFVEYPTVLPPHGSCAAAPLSDADADALREVARRLLLITARVAKDAGADLVPAARLTAAHGACSTDPWMNGFPSPGAPVKGAPYHPNLAGMTAVADALDRLISR